MSVLLFRGGGGGGKMAAHGGSAAAAALKGLIQQFTAITGKRRGYGKVKSWLPGGCRGCPGLRLTFVRSSLGLPSAPALSRGTDDDGVRGLRFRREADFPHPHPTRAP